MTDSKEGKPSVISIEDEGSLGVVSHGWVKGREEVDEVVDIGSSKKRKKSDGDKALEANRSQEPNEESLKVGSRGEVHEEVLNKEEK